MNRKNKTESILVVEDEPTIRDVCQRVLADEGYHVEIAENGEEAIKMISDEDYSLILVDIRTPRIDGQELYIWLLQVKPSTAKRIIFTTGDVMGSQIQRFIKYTKRPFLPKPFSSKDLMKTVKKAMVSTN